MRQQTLSTIKAGMTRLRSKGGASPDALYDLLNGYVTVAQTVKSRPGTRMAYTIPAGCKGMVWFKGKFVVFSHVPVASTSPMVQVEVLPHPENGTSNNAPLAEIHYALPFLGHLYVVAEFADGLIRHYWLETGPTWTPGKIYQAGDIVRPTNGDMGLVYVVVNTHNGLPTWEPDVAYQDGDVVLPTTYNGYRYVVVDTGGDKPHSGPVEPPWPTVPDATVHDDADNTPREPTPLPGADEALPRSLDPRYAGGPRSRNGNTTVVV